MLNRLLPLLTLGLLGVPLVASAAPYALETAQSCAMMVTDSQGNLDSVTEPAGYVFDVVQWNGSSPFSPVDPCGSVATKVAQVSGSPALNSGGVALTLTPAETGALDYNTYISAGVTITSTQYGPVGTFAADAASIANIVGALTYYQGNGATLPFTGLGWPYNASSPGYALFSTTTELINTLYAVLKFRYQCFVGEEYVINSIANPPWPATAVTIP